MAALILPSRRIAQPPGPMEVDWSNPLTANLICAVDSRGWDYARRTALATLQNSNALNTNQSKYGTARFATNNQLIWTSVNGISTSTNATHMIIGAPRTSGNFQVMAINHGLVLRRLQNSGTNFTVVADVLPKVFDFPNWTGVQVVVHTVGADANTQQFAYLDGKPLTFVTSPSNEVASYEVTIGGSRTGDRVDNVTYWDQPIVLSARWTRQLSAAEVAQVSENPWQLFKPIERRIWVDVAGAANFPLDTVVGTYSLTGASATTLWTHRLETTPGVYSVTGLSADLTITAANQFLLETTPGSYALTGLSATSEWDRLSQTVSGAYSLTGQSATTAEGLLVSVTSGSYAISGASATTLNGRQLQTSVGSYVVSGVSADLTPEFANPILETVPGVYTITGFDAELTAPSGLIDTHDGFWAREYRKMWERKPKVAEVVEIVKDEPIAALEVVREIVEQKYDLPDNRAELSRFILQSVQLQRFIANQLILAAQKRAIDDEEADIEEILLMI